MPEDQQSQLKHKLANVEQQKMALQQMLKKASDEIEGLVEGECSEADKETARKAAERFRKASSL